MRIVPHENGTGSVGDLSRDTWTNSPAYSLAEICIIRQEPRLWRWRVDLPASLKASCNAAVVVVVLKPRLEEGDTSLSYRRSKVPWRKLFRRLKDLWWHTKGSCGLSLHAVHTFGMVWSILDRQELSRQQYLHPNCARINLVHQDSSGSLTAMGCTCIPRTRREFMKVLMDSRWMTFKACGCGVLYSGFCLKYCMESVWSSKPFVPV